MSELIKKIAKYTGFSTEQVREYAERAPITYVHYVVEKASGNNRIISQPNLQTKALQYALWDTYLSRISIHESAYAYIRNKQSPVLANARAHADYKYHVRIDFRNFFHCISPDDLFRVLDSESLPTLSEFDKKLLIDILFMFIPVRLEPTLNQTMKASAIEGKRGLSIGAPTSPVISNLVMKTFDANMTEYASQRGSKYTRYADDIVYSTNTKGESNEFHEYLSQYLEKDSMNLRINSEKTMFMSNKGRKLITGLIISNTGNVSIGHRKKRELRKSIYNAKCGNLSSEKIISLKGYLNYVADIEPAYIGILTKKYGADVIAEIMNKQ